MKKTMIALACVLVSSGAFAASIIHGNSTTYSNGSGYYEFESDYSSVITKGGSYADADGGVVTVGEHNTYVTKSTDHSGPTSSGGVSNSTWINAGGLVWGDTLSYSVKYEEFTNGLSIYSSIIDPYHVITTHPDGQEVDEWVQNDSVFRQDNFSGSSLTITDTSGIFME